MGALKSFSPDMSFHMLLIIPFIWKSFPTNGAFIWRLPSMSLHMTIKSILCENTFSQREHWHGFSPVWVFIWLPRLQLCENIFSQWMHWYGFLTLWVLYRGGGRSWYNTPWRLVRGGIGRIFSELQLVLWVLTALILCIFETFWPISTNIFGKLEYLRENVANKNRAPQQKLLFRLDFPNQYFS